MKQCERGTTDHRGGLEGSVCLALLLPRVLLGMGGVMDHRHTRRASSTMPGSMLVHVRCRIVSMLHSDCVNPAKSKLLSLVEPPAPHVTLIAIGCSAERREIREMRLSNPWNEFKYKNERANGANLICARRKELECIKRLGGIMDSDFV